MVGVERVAGMGEGEVMAGVWYFHGYQPREAVSRLLRRAGDWLAYEEVKDEVPLSVIAVRRPAAGLAFIRLRLGVNGKMYAEKEAGFDCLESLIHHYTKDRTPILRGQPGTELLRPIRLEPWHIFPSELIADSDQKLLGNGCFGQVLKLKLLREGSPGLPVPVAVKECLSTAPKDREAFFREAMMTLRAQSPFVVAMYGLCTLQTPIRMILEFLPLGDLNSFLKSHHGSSRRSTLWQLSKWAIDTASALAHCASLGLIHLDVATRNCLLKPDLPPESGLRALLADFGLTRDGPTYDIQDGDPISHRWAAPETLRSPGAIATSASDVWAWGVLLWELFSDGSTPYPDLENCQGLLVRLEDGHRMRPPKHLPEALQPLLRSCWELQPPARPTFNAILPVLHKSIASFPRTPSDSTHPLSLTSRLLVSFTLRPLLVISPSASIAALRVSLFSGSIKGKSRELTPG